MEIPKLKYSIDNWEYETKCRRCGSFTMWHYGEKTTHEYTQFSLYMIDCLQCPRIYHCKECDYSTVQDVTSYNLHTNR